MLVKIYKKLKNEKDLFQKLIIEEITNVDNKGRYSFLTEKGKQFISESKKLINSIRKEHLVLNIVNLNKNESKKFLKRKLNGFYRRKNGKTLFLLTLLNVVPVEKIKTAISPRKKPPTIINYSEDKPIIKNGDDIKNKMNIIIQSPEWKIKIKSRGNSPDLPYSSSNIKKIRYNKKNKNGIIEFDTIDYYINYSNYKTEITMKEMIIHKNYIGILVMVNNYRSYKKYFRKACYNIGFYFEITDRIISKVKKVKNLEEFSDFIKTEAEKTSKTKKKNTE